MLHDTADSGGGQTVPDSKTSNTPHTDTTQYRVDYRYRMIVRVEHDSDGEYNVTGMWRKSHVVIETLSVLSAWNKAETAIRSKHPSCEFAIIKVIRLDAQRGESEAR